MSTVKRQRPRRPPAPAARAPRLPSLEAADAAARQASTALDDGRHADAAAGFRRAAVLAPHRASVWHNYAEALRGLADDDAALAAYRRALRLRPAYPKALAGMAAIEAKRQRRRLALRLLMHAVMLDPAFVEAWKGLALGLHHERRIDRAVTMLRRAVLVDPLAPAGWQELAAGLSEIGEDEEADRCCRTALALDPGRGAGYLAYGGLCVNQGRLDDVVALNARARQINPTDGGADAGDSVVCVLTGDFERARHLARRAVALQPGFAVAYINLSLAESGREGGRLSRLYNERALLLHRDSDVARFNLSMALLAQGQFREGWELYEARWRMRNTPLPTFAPLWDGSDPAGRTILVVCEQGQGDTLHFVRYAPLLAERGARVRLLVQPALKRLMSGLPGILSVHGTDEDPPPSDLCIPLLSLPRLFGTTLDSVPAAVPYLAGSEADRAGWRARLAGETRLKVGLVWAGDAHKGQVTATMVDRRRSVALADLAPLAGVPGVAFYSLQKGPPAAQAKAPPPGLELTDWMDAVGDFADTAAFIEQLDLVISVDTSVCHLAGALGTPVWVLSRFDACWRWLGNRADNPWYPTLRLFGQESPGDWTPVIARVAEALRRRVETGPAQPAPLPVRRPAAPSRLRLNDITLVCADTAYPQASLLALQHTLARCEPDETLFFTDVPGDEPGIRRVPIAPIDGTAGYSHFMMKELFRHVDTPFVLVVQWDGFVVDPTRWSDDFLRYDYVGARWVHYSDGHTVGNGGFSLRSRRLLEALQDCSIARVAVEDDAICRTYRPYLQRTHGIAFAPPALADRFSQEWSEEARAPFGFHGLLNLVRHLGPQDLAAVFDAVPDKYLAGHPLIRDVLNWLVARRRLNEALALSARIDRAAAATA